MPDPAGIGIVRDEPLLETKILRVHRRIYRAGGVDHPWEMVSRRATAGIVACLPVTASGEIVFLRQFRIPLGRPVIEIVAGIVEVGESPDVAIARELSEEAGLVADTFEKIADFTTSAGLTDELIATYIARGCRPDPDARHSGEAAEEIETVHLPLARAWEWLCSRAAEEIIDPKTFATLAHVLREPAS